MKIALIGYGKMGKIIHEGALQKGWDVVFIANSQTTDWHGLKNAQVAIEFTHPKAGFLNVNKCLDMGIPVVSGTTGWDAALPTAITKCKELNGAFLHATNFSIGVNVVFELNKQLAAIMNRLEGYTADLTEIHHTQKLDAPSGTAITLANGIIAKHQLYTAYTLTPDLQEGALPITAQRKDPAPGTHLVTWASAIDKITLSHEAFNRKGFAAGALMAAEWVADKKGHFTMADLLQL